MSGIKLKGKGKKGGGISISKFPLFEPWDWVIWLTWKYQLNKYERLCKKRERKKK